MLEKLGRPAEAASAYRTAIALRPNWPEPRFNLANALRACGRIHDAVGSYRAAVRLRPRYVKALANLAVALADEGELDESLACARRVVEIEPKSPAARSGLLYALHYSPRYDAEALYREHVEWGWRFCEPLLNKIRPHENDRDLTAGGGCATCRKLRVGYVSPDFRQHTPPKFITAAFRHHDPDRFELFCYSDAPKTDAVTDRLKGMVEHWHETRKLSDSDLEQLIRQDRIDILVDLRGHAADNRLPLFARKPAPVQVNMVGYFNTTGLGTMDYRITDQHMDPPGVSEHLHTEKLMRMPHSCWCFTPDEDAPDVQEPPALKNGYITFGSLNKIVKVSEPCARLWAGVLEAVPNSRILLSVAGEDAAPIVRERRAGYGLPAHRIHILGKTSTAREYLERYHRIDVALDTIPFNGITTTCEGLWMGVPCVSLAGQTSVSRAGRSILHAANLPELAADSPEQFIGVATELANDLRRLRELRLTMRARLLASALMDHRRFARDLEFAYGQMWRAWCQKNPQCITG